MNSLIVSSSTSRTATATNEIRLDFTQAPLELKDKEISLAYLGLYYSWKNITAAYGNNSFSYIYNGTTYPVALPDGYYTIEDLNNFLQLTMTTNNHYMLDVDGEMVFFASMEINVTYYAVTFVLDVVAVPSGGTNPHTLVTGVTMQLVIPDTEFATIVGFDNATYPTSASATAYSINSQHVPVISPVATVHVTTNVSNNNYNQYRDTIYTFSPVSDFASYLNITPYYPIWYKVVDGTYDNISIRFYDQDYRPLQLVDKYQIVCNLLFRNILEK